MSEAERSEIRQEVLNFMGTQSEPVGFGSIVDKVRNQTGLSEVRDSEVLTVVQSMIVTGRLEYAPGLAIRRTEGNAG